MESGINPSYITLAQPVCSVSFTYEHEALFQMRRGMRDGDDGWHLQDGCMEWWQRWIDALAGWEDEG